MCVDNATVVSIILHTQLWHLYQWPKCNKTKIIPFEIAVSNKYHIPGDVSTSFEEQRYIQIPNKD